MSTDIPISPRVNTIRRVLIILALGLVTILVILKLSGFHASWEKFRTLDIRFILAAFAVYYFAFWIRAVRWKILLLAVNRDLPILTLFSYLLVGWFISAALPARAGDVARAYFLKSDRGVPLRRGFSSIFVERGLDGLVILSCSLIFSFFILSLGLPKWVLTLYQVTFSFLLVAILFLYFVPRLESRIRSLSQSARYQKITGFLFRLMEKIRFMASHPWQMLAALFLSLIIWLCDALVTYLVLLGLNNPLPLPWVAFISFTVNLVATIPITPGAVGQIDAVQFSLFSLIGVARDISGVTILISRFICFWSFLLISGLVTYGTGLARLIRTLPGRRSILETHMESVQQKDRLHSGVLG